MNIVDAPNMVFSWDHGSRRVWSLLDLYRIKAQRLVEIGSHLQNFWGNHEVATKTNEPVSLEHLKIVQTLLGAILKDCQFLKIVRTATAIELLLNEYTPKEQTGRTYMQLRQSIQHLNVLFHQDLNAQVFCSLDSERAVYMKSIEEHQKEPTYGNAVQNNFVSADRDVHEAAICFATFRNTACVFHCMRVAEKGLIALAKALKVAFKVPFEYENWHNIIEPIEKEIKAQEQTLPKGPIKAETLKLYSQAATQFFYFKNAWRNHVAHSRDIYDDEQAELIFKHVGDFMRFLADGGLHD